ncbi:cathelicidin-6-like [Rhinoderma darwinii]|uniref:cathelicidin-6-like n=1 Tax=Rhinoderma darwinii TaxID=43563 RepID=UPI003F678513
MRSWGLSLLFFSAVTLHGGLSDVQNKRPIRDVIDIYNQREGVTYLYKTLEQLPPAKLEEDEIPNRRTFIIKETVCLKSNNPDLSKCDYKSDGEEKICVLGDENHEEIICSSLTKDVHVKRNSKKPCSKKPCRRLPGGYSFVFPPIDYNRP